MALERRPDGELIVVTGASRSGKTQWTVRRVRSARRLLVWDSMGEWGDRFGCRRVATFAELRECVKPGARAERLAFYQPGMAQHFDVFCSLSWVWIRAARGALVIEELSSVTSPGKAPRMWGEICRAGLRYGPDIIAITQRPAESDKTCIGNATLLHCHQMVREADEAYMARELRVPVAQLSRLRPLDWLERDRRTHQVRGGKITFPRRAA